MTEPDAAAVNIDDDDDDDDVVYQVWYSSVCPTSSRSRFGHAAAGFMRRPR